MIKRRQIGAFTLFFIIPLLLKVIDAYALPTIPDENGTYCARVKYYNPNTDTKSTYIIPVEVHDQSIVKIKWNNGGWLDETHFNAKDISEGTARIKTDKGYIYEIKLKYFGECD